MINIPTYRAKKIDSEDYVTGLLDEKRQSDGTHLYYRIPVLGWEIDPSTLAINFPDMKDSNDKPIFASLSESGKGGDIYESKYQSGSVLVMNSEAQIVASFPFIGSHSVSLEWKKIKVIGIQND